MSTSGPVRRTVRLAAPIFLLAIAACGGDSQGPDGGGTPSTYTPIVVGDTVPGALVATAEEASFTFRVTDSGQMALFATSDAVVGLTVSDSAVGQPLAFVLAGGIPNDALLKHRTERFQVSPGHTYVVRARHQFEVATSHFRMFLYQVNPAPEHRSAAIAVGDTVTGEWLENSADVDEFQFTAHAGDEFIGFVQAADSIVPGVLTLVARGPDGSDLATAESDTATAELESVATGRFVVQSDGTYRVVVVGAAVYTDSSYRFQVSRINRAPESGPVTVSVGDTVTGIIEHVGDVDEFILQGPPDQEFNLFLQALTDTAHVLHAEMSGEVIVDVSFPMESSGRDTSLFSQASTTVKLPPSGSAIVRVMGRSEFRGLDRGNYRFFAYPINRAPESGPAALVVGDSVDGTLEAPGDIDEFQLTVPTTRLVNLVFALPTGRGVVTLTRLDVTGQIFIAEQRLFGNTTGEPDRNATGPFELGQSVYRLRVDGGSGGGALRGPYHIAVYPIDPAPESVPGTLTYDVPVTGESLNPLGDVDQFTFIGAKGDVLDGWVQGIAGSGAVGLSVAPSGTNTPLAGVFSQFGGDSAETTRIILRADGSYTATLRDDFTSLSEGSYRIVLHRVPTDPEHEPAAITPGVIVGSEQIDRPGDVDEFVLTAAAGSELAITLQGMQNVMTKLEVDEPVTYDSVAGVQSAGFPQATGRFLMPAGGQGRIRVYMGGLLTGATGPYTFKVIPIVRAPESASAALTRGVVRTGESLDYAGDIDEFTFSATAGETIQAFLNTPHGFSGSGEVRLQVVEPGTGTVLGSVTSHNPPPGQFGAATPQITLTTSGTYRLRLMNTDDKDTGTGDYEVVVQ